jgi:trigger factor
MNITTEQKQGGTLLVTVTVTDADYAAEVDKRLREYRRSANMPGFRPGMVPMGIIRKMYRKGVVAEQAYRSANEGAYKYLQDNKIEYMGDLLPSDEQGELDFDNDTEFVFKFEIGEAPVVDINLDDNDKLTYYKIKVDEGMKNSWRSNFMRRFGHLEDVDSVTSDEALEVSLDNGTLHVDDAHIGLVSLSEEERKQFVGKKLGDSMIVNINELYKNPQQAASILAIEQSELASIQPEFTATITKIRRFVEPTLDEEFFKIAFPEGDVTDEAGFDKYVDEQIEKELAKESDYLLSVQLREYLLKKANLAMPEEFLHRWLLAVNEGKFTNEEIEHDFPKFLNMMTWGRIENHYFDTLGLKMEKEDMLAEAKNIARAQFAQYGMSQVPDQYLTDYANNILSKEDESRYIFDQVRERKVIDAVKGLIKLKEKSVSVEEFQKIANSLTE